MFGNLLRLLLGEGKTEAATDAEQDANLAQSNKQIFTQTSKKKKHAQPRRGRQKNQRKRVWAKSTSPTKTNYIVQKDGTAIDAFVVRLLQAVAPEEPRVEVGGLTGNSKKQDHACYRYLDMEPPLASEIIKRYWVRLALPLDGHDFWGFQGLFPENIWENGYDHEVAKELNARARALVLNRLDTFLKTEVTRIGVAYSRGNAQYISFGVEVEVAALDALTHCQVKLTDYGKLHIHEIAKQVDQIIAQKNVTSWATLYGEPEKFDKLVRNAENRLRERNGMPKIGEGWLNESLLFQLIKEQFPKAKREYSPEWLGRQRFDIYIPGVRVAVEYNGAQHYEEVDHFGGKAALKKVRKNDARKRELAEKNGVTLIDWPYTRPVTEDEVLELVSMFMDTNTPS